MISLFSTLIIKQTNVFLLRVKVRQQEFAIVLALLLAALLFLDLHINALPAQRDGILCGKGKMEKELDLKGYVQYEYINEELPDLLAMADIILSRAGANAVFELLALRKPMLLVPLTAKSTRGDQLLNAEYFERNGYAKILLQQNLTPVTLSEALNALYKDREKYQRAMETAENVDGTQPILNIILQAAGE